MLCLRKIYTTKSKKSKFNIVTKRYLSEWKLSFVK